MVVQDDTVFVSGMDTEVTESEINTHFGAIGIIKVHIFSSLLLYSISTPNNNLIYRKIKGRINQKFGFIVTKNQAKEKENVL